MTLFDTVVIPHILSIRCPDPLDSPDTPFWKLSGKQSFDIKSAYTSLSGNLWDAETQSWRNIWSLRVSQRLLFFLWLSLKGKLMTNAERYRRFLCSHPLCPCCQYAANLCYMSSVIIAMLKKFGAFCFPRNAMLWKARNDLVFNDNPFNVDLLHRRSVLSARYYSENSSIAVPMYPSPSSTHYWQQPVVGWVAWDNRLERVLIQSDNKEAIKHLNVMTSTFDPYSLVRAVAKMRDRGWTTDTQWILREGNKHADMLAKLDNLPNYDVTIFSQPPERLLPLIDFDMLHSL
ncbi:hypothetical protein V6N12_066707 [Hibiscus sabdariffa]|uniref:Reverse transcriptase zinc-binding domain-containing protein n=1 Tax=Hibiscus sabdariffa TaxID=183260 RepID=A0ABR2BDG8_9ROSI